jgi:hypothetical protein
MTWLPVLAALCVLTAGCLGGGADEDAPTTPPAGDQGTGEGPGVNGTSAPAVIGPPSWTVGQSWTWRLTGSSLAEAREGTSVLLSANAGTYDVGASDVDAGAALFPFHTVAFGAVDASCLCWEAHGHPVQFLRFPLADGDRFTADFWAAPGAQVAVNATEVAGPGGPQPGFRSIATYADGRVFAEADYAPALGQFVRVATFFGAAEPFVEALLVGEATGASGVGFRATELARFTASAADPASLAPHPVTVPDGSEVVLLACFLPGAQGFYGAELSTAGVPLACGGGSTDRTMYAGTHTAATPGPGAVTPAIGGQGSANIEVFAVDTTVTTA